MSPARTAVTARWTLLPSGLAEGVTVLVEGGRIAAVVHGDVAADRRIRVEQGVLVPGFVNLHNHALNGPVFRGIVDDTEPGHTADGLVYSLLLPLGDHVADVLDSDELQAVFRLALLEVLRSGATTVLDMPRLTHTPPLLAAAREVGLRIVAAPYLFSTPTSGTDRDGRPRYGAADEQLAFAEAVRLADAHDGGPDALVRVGFGPHATDTCSPQLLGRVAREARERGAVVTVHVAQSRAEVATVRERYGTTPVEYLHGAGVLGPRTVAAHCVHAHGRELDLLRETGTTVANCPLTFARSGVTVPFDRFQRRGVRTGIGTDAYSFDYLAELRAAGFVSKLSSGESAATDAVTLLRAATEVGADALGVPGLGRVAKGSPADLVVVDLGGPALQPVRDPLKNLVWNATPAAVSMVMVAGSVLVEDGVVAGCDEPAAVRAGAAAVERLWESAERHGLLAAAGSRS